MSIRKPAYRALLRAADQPWAITQPMLKTIAQIALRQNETVQALEAKRGAPLDNTYDVTVRDGIATIPVHGVLSRYASIFSEVSAMTSYDWLALETRTAWENGAVRAIILDINSPGGEVDGVDEYVRQLRAMRDADTKPIVAYVGGQACSAAYWIASGCHRIVCQATAELGSIGVVAMVTDYSKQRKAAGIEDMEFVSSQSPKKRLDPGTDEGKKSVVAKCDALCAVFIGTVADNRGVDPEDVQKNYGQGDSFIGADAVEAGLADELGDYESLFAELAGRDEPATEPFASPNPTTATVRRKVMAKHAPKTAGKKPAATNSPKAKAKTKSKADIDEEVDEVEQIEDEENQLDAEEVDDETSAEDGDEEDTSAEDDETDDEKKVDDQKNAEDDETEDEGDEKPPASKKSKSKATGERGRIAAILQSNAAQGRKDLAEHLAFNTDMSARDVVNALKAAPRGSATGAPDFRKALAGQNPGVGAGGGATKPTGEQAEVNETLALAKKHGLA